MKLFISRLTRPILSYLAKPYTNELFHWQIKLDMTHKYKINFHFSMYEIARDPVGDFPSTGLEIKSLSDFE